MHTRPARRGARHACCLGGARRGRKPRRRCAYRRVRGARRRPLDHRDLVSRRGWRARRVRHPLRLHDGRDARHRNHSRTPPAGAVLTWARRHAPSVDLLDGAARVTRLRGRGGRPSVRHHLRPRLRHDPDGRGPPARSGLSDARRRSGLRRRPLPLALRRNRQRPDRNGRPQLRRMDDPGRRGRHPRHSHRRSILCGLRCVRGL